MDNKSAPVSERGLIALLAAITVLAISGLFSVACALTQTTDYLVLFRFLQALGGSASLVAGRALLADIYRGDTLAQKNSTINMFLALAPMIGPECWFVRWVDRWKSVTGYLVFIRGVFRYCSPNGGAMGPEGIKLWM